MPHPPLRSHSLSQLYSLHRLLLLPSLLSLPLYRIMEPVTQPFNENDIKAQLAKTKFDQKWEVLKPVIRKMWIEEDRKLSELMKDIQACYGFTAESVFLIPHSRPADSDSFRIENLNTNTTSRNGSGKETFRPKRKTHCVKSVTRVRRRGNQLILSIMARLSMRKSCAGI